MGSPGFSMSTLSQHHHHHHHHHRRTEAIASAQRESRLSCSWDALERGEKEAAEAAEKEEEEKPSGNFYLGYAPARWRRKKQRWRVEERRKRKGGAAAAGSPVNWRASISLVEVSVATSKEQVAVFGATQVRRTADALIIREKEREANLGYGQSQLQGKCKSLSCEVAKVIWRDQENNHTDEGKQQNAATFPTTNFSETPTCQLVVFGAQSETMTNKLRGPTCDYMREGANHLTSPLKDEGYERSRIKSEVSKSQPFVERRRERENEEEDDDDDGKKKSVGQCLFHLKYCISGSEQGDLKATTLNVNLSAKEQEGTRGKRRKTRQHHMAKVYSHSCCCFYCYKSRRKRIRKPLASNISQLFLQILLQFQLTSALNYPSSSLSQPTHYNDYHIHSNSSNSNLHLAAPGKTSITTCQLALHSPRASLSVFPSLLQCCHFPGGLDEIFIANNLSNCFSSSGKLARNEDKEKEFPVKFNTKIRDSLPVDLGLNVARQEEGWKVESSPSPSPSPFPSAIKKEDKFHETRRKDCWNSSLEFVSLPNRKKLVFISFSSSTLGLPKNGSGSMKRAKSSLMLSPSKWALLSTHSGCQNWRPFKWVGCCIKRESSAAAGSSLLLEGDKASCPTRLGIPIGQHSSGTRVSKQEQWWFPFRLRQDCLAAELDADGPSGKLTRKEDEDEDEEEEGEGEFRGSAVKTKQFEKIAELNCFPDEQDDDESGATEKRSSFRFLICSASITSTSPSPSSLYAHFFPHAARSCAPNLNYSPTNGRLRNTTCKILCIKPKIQQQQQPPGKVKILIRFLPSLLCRCLLYQSPATQRVDGKVKWSGSSQLSLPLLLLLLLHTVRQEAFGKSHPLRRPNFRTFKDAARDNADRLLEEVELASWIVESSSQVERSAGRASYLRWISCASMPILPCLSLPRLLQGENYNNIIINPEKFVHKTEDSPSSLQAKLSTLSARKTLMLLAVTTDEELKLPLIPMAPPPPPPSSSTCFRTLKSGNWKLCDKSDFSLPRLSYNNDYDYDYDLVQLELSSLRELERVRIRPKAKNLSYLKPIRAAFTLATTLKIDEYAKKKHWYPQPCSYHKRLNYQPSLALLVGKITRHQQQHADEQASCLFSKQDDDDDLAASDYFLDHHELVVKESKRLTNDDVESEAISMLIRLTASIKRFLLYFSSTKFLLMAKAQLVYPPLPLPIIRYRTRSLMESNNKWLSGHYELSNKNVLDKQEQRAADIDYSATSLKVTSYGAQKRDRENWIRRKEGKQIIPNERKVRVRSTNIDCSPASLPDKEGDLSGASRATVSCATRTTNYINDSSPESNLFERKERKLINDEEENLRGERKYYENKYHEQDIIEQEEDDFNVCFIDQQQQPCSSRPLLPEQVGEKGNSADQAKVVWRKHCRITFIPESSLKQKLSSSSEEISRPPGEPEVVCCCSKEHKKNKKKKQQDTGWFTIERKDKIDNLSRAPDSLFVTILDASSSTESSIPSTTINAKLINRSIRRRDSTAQAASHLLLLLKSRHNTNIEKPPQQEAENSYFKTYYMEIIDHSLPITLILGLIILVTFVGNVLVCLSVIKVRKLRHPSNYLLISLAISDLCVACVVMPFGLYQAINDKWQLGRLLCNVYVVSDVTSCTASILNLCVISIDRYLAITRPLTYCAKRTTRLMMILIGIVWICACLISVPPLLISGNEYGTPEEPRCEVSQILWYQLYATCISFYIPLIVMICLYYNIYTAAKKVVEAEQRATTGLHVPPTSITTSAPAPPVESSTAITANSTPLPALACNSNSNNQATVPVSTLPLASSTTAPAPTITSRTSSVMRERKASITLGVIMSAFTICWVPFFIIALLRPFSETVNNLPRTFVLLTLWLGYANSLLNPIIYVTFHHDFRNAFKHLLCFRCMTINEHIRKDEYKSQYGETHYQENIRKIRNQQQQQQQLLSKKVTQLA